MHRYRRPRDYVRRYPGSRYLAREGRSRNRAGARAGAKSAIRYSARNNNKRHHAGSHAEMLRAKRISLSLSLSPATQIVIRRSRSIRLSLSLSLSLSPPLPLFVASFLAFPLCQRYTKEKTLTRRALTVTLYIYSFFCVVSRLEFVRRALVYFSREPSRTCHLPDGLAGFSSGYFSGCVPSISAFPESLA